MANNYLQFSMTVPLTTETEQAWCSASLAALDKFLSGTETPITDRKIKMHSAS